MINYAIYIYYNAVRVNVTILNVYTYKIKFDHVIINENSKLTDMNTCNIIQV